MNPTYALILAVFVPALLGGVCLLPPRRWVGLRVAVALLAPALSLVCLATYLRSNGTTAGPVGVEWMPSLQLALSFNADRFGAFFALLVASVGVPIVLYARAYFGPDQNALYRLYPVLLLFMTGMLGLALADNFILLLLFWELTSISSFLLIGWERDDPPAVRNALQAFIVTGAGGISLLGGLVLLGLSTGVWGFSALTPDLVTGARPGATAAFVLIFAGAAAKSAQWPLHFWLPGAMAAPTPISAYLHSATMVKAGVYLFGRLLEPMSVLPLWPYLLIPVGAVTMVLGAYVAVRKSDLKLIFAYTTVSQLGLFVCMYGAAAFQYEGRPALQWDVTQILNHAFYKAPLFILAGAIAHTAYSRDLRDLYGLFHRGGKERVLVVLLLLAAYAMAAGPLTLGFLSKEYFLYGIYEAFKASGRVTLLGVLAAAVCQSALNVVIFMRLVLTLLGPEGAAASQPPHDPAAEEERIAFEDYHSVETGFWAWMLWLPAAALLLLQYVGGIAPRFLDLAIGGLERHRAGLDWLPGLWYALTHPGLPLALSAAAIAAGIAIALAPVPLGRPPVWRNSIRDPHDSLFPRFYTLVTVGGRGVFRRLQTGDLRTYLGIICCTLVLLTSWAIVHSGTAPELTRRTLGDAPRLEYVPVYAMGGLACVGALMMPFGRHRGGRVMVLGTVGFAVAGMFYLYAAPDVALTQVAIEIVALILFLLALGLLPRTSAAAKRPARSQVPRLAVSIAVGLVMGWMVMSSTLEPRPAMSFANPEARPFDYLGDFFLRNSYEGQDVPGRHPGGGGNNVVNVILVDFRGFDTLGEITVLGAAAIGVLVLLRRWSIRPDTPDPETAPAPAQENAFACTSPTAPVQGRVTRTGRWRHNLSSEPLRVATKLLVPLSLLFAAFLFLKGHQTPGGGFVAGLVAAVALTAHRMAHGRASLRHLLRVRGTTLIAVGLAVALGTGLAATLFSEPFLTSRYGYLSVPGTEQRVEWATVLAFDLGVFLVVLGVVQTMINAMSEEAEAA